MDPFERLRELIDIEHKAEREQNMLELSRFPASVREAIGKSVTRLTVELTEEAIPGDVPALPGARSSPPSTP